MEKKPAINARLGHNKLPEGCFTIYPPTDYKMHQLPDGSKEIVIARVLPDERYTISYLYSSPLTVQEMNTYVKHDDGCADLWQKFQYTKILSIWKKWSIITIFFIGSSFILYFLLRAMAFFYYHL